MTVAWTLMPQVPTGLPSEARVTVIWPCIPSLTLNPVTVLPFNVSDPRAQMFKPSLPTRPFCVVHAASVILSVPSKLQEVFDELHDPFTSPATVTVPLTAQLTVVDWYTALLRISGLCVGCRATALNAPETIVMMSAESAVVKLPDVGSTQLEPPQLTKAAAAAIAILLFIWGIPSCHSCSPEDES